MRIIVELTEAEASSTTIQAPRVGPEATTSAAANGGPPAEGLLLALGGARVVTELPGHARPGPGADLDAGHAPASLEALIKSLGRGPE